MSDPIATLLLDNVHPRAGRGPWHGGPTTMGALRGVTVGQAAWRPQHGRKSIWQLTLHIAYWEYAVRRRLDDEAEQGFPRSPANWPEPGGADDARAWKADVALLRAEHEALVDTIAAIPVKQYGRRTRGGKQWTVGELIVGIAQHDAYHIGQIQMLKRMWQAAHAKRT